jgi:hypothetical protein
VRATEWLVVDPQIWSSEIGIDFEVPLQVVSELSVIGIFPLLMSQRGPFSIRLFGVCRSQMICALSQQLATVCPISLLSPYPCRRPRYDDFLALTNPIQSRRLTTEKPGQNPDQSFLL